jgi:ligand-binding SRPBCC domain-containing protein
MSSLREITIIRAPIALCFALSLDIDLEARSEQMRAVSGVISGRIALGQTVTWRLREFGIWLTHTTLISELTEPSYFQDRMVGGVFKSFTHDHFFRTLPDGQTQMIDVLQLAMPWLLGGRISEAMYVTRRLRATLHRRNTTIKQAAEAAAG